MEHRKGFALGRPASGGRAVSCSIDTARPAPLLPRYCIEGIDGPEGFAASAGFACRACGPVRPVTPGIAPRFPAIAPGVGFRFKAPYSPAIAFFLRETYSESSEAAKSAYKRFLCVS